MRRYIAVCLCMVMGITVYLVYSSIPMKASFDEWEADLKIGEDYEILHTESLLRRQELAVVKLKDPVGERLIVLVGQNRLTHWKLIESVDLGHYMTASPGHFVEESLLSAGYVMNDEVPPSEQCTLVQIQDTSYVLWYHLNEPGNHLGN